MYDCLTMEILYVSVGSMSSLLIYPSILAWSQKSIEIHQLKIKKQRAATIKLHML